MPSSCTQRAALMAYCSSSIGLMRVAQPRSLSQSQVS
nr:MAG TPA: hypothetical protein [Caudoviricetes sp.]